MFVFTGVRHANIIRLFGIMMPRTPTMLNSYTVLQETLCQVRLNEKQACFPTLTLADDRLFLLQLFSTEIQTLAAGSLPLCQSFLVLH